MYKERIKLPQNSVLPKGSVSLKTFLEYHKRRILALGIDTLLRYYITMLGNTTKYTNVPMTLSMVFLKCPEVGIVCGDRSISVH